VAFPRALRDRPFDFSFSGLKTSVVTYLEQAREAGTLPDRADVSASIQEAIVDVLVEKTFNAVEATGVEVIAGGGGVLANRRLRERLTDEANRRGVGMFVPEPLLCTDNGAMIAGVAVDRIVDRRPGDELGGDVDPGLVLGS
jgi:N6-L-threonylcarbamoyladenine synthase